MDSIARAACAAAVLLSPAGASAATASASFQVAAQVIVGCTVAPGPGSGARRPVCQRAQPAAASTKPPPDPVVTYQRDARTGAVVRMVTF